MLKQKKQCKLTSTYIEINKTMTIMTVVFFHVSNSFLCLFNDCPPFFILTCRHLLRGIVFLAKKKKKKCAELISHHHIIKLSRTIFCLLNPLHICVLIIDSLLYRQQNATKITEQCSKDGKKPSVRFDRLSRLITSLKHRGEEEKEGECALDSCTSKGVPVLNIFKALCLENISLYFSGRWKYED